MHGGVAHLVLLLERGVVVVVRVLVARLIVGARNAAETSLESGTPATHTLVPSIERDEADEDGALGEVGAEAAPERVPPARLVVDARDLQEPVPDGDHDAPSSRRANGSTERL